MATETTDAQEGMKDASIPAERDERQERVEQQDEAPKDVRGAIRAAFKEHAEEESSEPDGEREPRQRASKRTKQDKEDDSSDDVDQGVQERRADRASRRRDREATQAEPKEKAQDNTKDALPIEAPPYYRIKGKAAWDKLDNESRQLLVAREQEVSNGFHQISQRLKQAEDMEHVIAPRAQAIQQFGVTPAQTVDRLFQWMEALAGPNKLHSFKELAKSFGVDVSQLSSPQQGSSQEQIQDQGPPEWFADFTNKVDQEIGGIKNQFRSQQEEAAVTFVKNWAKDKPFYQRVGPLMQQLIAAGVVGTTQDGIVDLDSAYDKACKLDPEVSALIQEEAKKQDALESAARAAKEAKERADKLSRARKAASGIKPNVATYVPVGQGKPNGSGKRETVRDSIRAALDEHRE